MGKGLQIALVVAISAVGAFWLRYGTFDPCEAARHAVVLATQSQYARDLADGMIDGASGARCLHLLWTAEVNPEVFGQ